MNFRYAMLLVLCVFSSMPANAAWLLTSPPREDPEEGEAMYGTLARYLSKQTGEQVVYVRPQGWIEYVNDMRSGKYDIIFDGPHFAAWRIKHLYHTPLARLPGKLTFVVIGKRSDTKLTKLKGLLNGGWCGLSSPNLATMVVMSKFKNPVAQPEFIEIADTNDIIPALKSGRCRAAGLPDRFFEKVDDDIKKELKLIYTSTPYPEQTITVSSRVPASAQVKMIAALTSITGVPAAQAIFAKFAKDTTHFIRAPEKEYKGLENLLEGVIWGW